jgi:hypothetical protein
MTQVPAVRTPFSPDALVAGLEAAYVAQLGHEPRHETLAVLCAHVALETANGDRCFDWDIGNFKAAPGADFQVFHTWEVVNGERVEMDCAFAAFSSLESGCEAYLHAMYTRWPLAWTAAVHGDPVAFAQGLKDQKPYPYYTAPVADYIANMRRWFPYYLARIGGDGEVTAPELPEPSPQDAAAQALDGLRAATDP